MKLPMHSNQIVDISALSGSTDLMELSIYSNEIVDVRVLSGLTNPT